MSLLFAPEPEFDDATCPDCTGDITTDPDYPHPFCVNGCDGPTYGSNGRLVCDYSNPDHDCELRSNR